MSDQQPKTDETRSFWESMGIFEDLQQGNSVEEPLNQTTEPQQTANIPALKEISGGTDSQQTASIHHPPTPELPSEVVKHVQVGHESGYGHLTLPPQNESETKANLEDVFTARTASPLSGKDAFEELIAYDPLNTANPETVQPLSHDLSGTSDLSMDKDLPNDSLSASTEDGHKEEPSFPGVSKILHGKQGHFKFRTGITPVMVITAGPSAFITETAHFPDTPLPEAPATPLPTLEPVAMQRSGLHPHRFSEGEIEPKEPVSTQSSGFRRRITTTQPGFKGTTLPKAITAIPVITAVTSEKELERLKKWYEKPLHFSAVLMSGFLLFFGVIGVYRFSQTDFIPINWQQMKLSLSGQDTGLQVESSTASASYVGGRGGRFPNRAEDWTPTDWARCGCPECTKNLNQWQAMQSSLSSRKGTSTLPDSSVVLSPGGKVDPLGSGSNDLYRTPQGANQTISPGGKIMY